MSDKPRIFVSYAHDDTEWLKKLDPWLKGLHQYAAVEFYDDRQGLGGVDWDAQIKANLETADIFLAVVTPNFIGSQYIYEIELPIARRRREEGTCVIMPLYMRRCHYRLLELSNVNFLPKDAEGHLTPLKEWDERLQDVALTQIVEHIEKQVQAVKAARTLTGKSAGRSGIDVAAYRRRAQAQWSAIDLAALAAPGATDADITIKLTDVFAMPGARRSRPPVTLARDYMILQGLDPDREEAGAADRAQAWERATSEPVLSLIAAPDRRLLVVLGDPGAGKSSLTRYVLLQLLAEAPDATSPLAALHGHVPFLIELRDFVLEESAGHCSDLIAYLDYCGRSLGFGFTAAAVQHHLANDRALLIVDGLDEIFDPARRKRMAEQIIGFAVHHPSLRVMLTSRIAGFDEHPFRSAGFEIATLVDLTPEQVNGFIETWFNLVFPGDPSAAQRARDDMRQTIERRPQLRVLAGNPMILTIMATIARHKPLARSRAAMYAQALELLCYNWDYRRGLKLPEDSPLRDLSAADTPLMLRRIAWRMQEASDGLRANAIGQSDLQTVIERFFLEDWRFEIPKARRATEEMVQRLQERNWVLTRRGPALFGFVHRTFLEYLCATELAERFKSQTLDAAGLIDGFVKPRLADDAWHEVLRLLAGSLPETAAEQIVLAMVPDDSEVVRDATCLGLAWQVLAEVEPRRISTLVLACARLTDSLYVYLKDSASGDSDPGLAIAEAAESLGSVVWPTTHPPGVPWPEASPKLPYIYPLLIGALGRSIWDCDTAAEQILCVRAVSDNDYYQRGGAIYALAEHFRDQPGTLDLIRGRAVNDPEGFPRGVAITALAERFRDQPGTLDLIRGRAVNDPESYPRSEAITALAEHFRDQPGTVDLIRDRAVNDPRGGPRGAAITALAEHFRDQPGTLDLIRGRAVNDPAGFPRGAAITALAEHFRDQPGTLDLIRDRAVNDPHGEPRGAAITALAERFRDRPGTLDLIRDRAVNDPHGEPRGSAIKALAAHFRDQPGILDLIRDRAVNDPDGASRGAVIAALSEHFRDQPGILDLIRDRAVNDPDGTSRGAVIAALAVHFRGNPGILDLIRDRTVNDPDGAPRGAAVTALAEHFRDQPGILDLIRDRAVNDPDGASRDAAVTALAEHFRDQPGTLNLIRDRAVNDPDGEPRVAAITALARHFRDQPGTLDLIRDRAVNDPHGEPRVAAITALARHFRDQPGTLDLIRDRAVNDPESEPRRASFLALASVLDTPNAKRLCSRDLDGVAPGLDPQEAVTDGDVERAVARLQISGPEIRALYEDIAAQLPLTLDWVHSQPCIAPPA